MAGRRCVLVYLPLPARFVLHKLCSNTKRQANPAWARKDLVQAAVLGAVGVETDAGSLQQAASNAPSSAVETTRSRLLALQELLQAHQQTLKAFEQALLLD